MADSSAFDFTGWGAGAPPHRTELLPAADLAVTPTPDRRTGAPVPAGRELHRPDPCGPDAGASSGLSRELVEQVKRRLGLLAAVFALSIAGVLGLELALVRVLGWPAPPYFDFRAGAQLGLVALSVAVVLLARSPRVCPYRMLVLGLGYQVVGALLIAQMALVDPAALGRFDLGTISWLCVWITLFPLVVPATPGRAALAGLLSASAPPLVLGLLRRGEPWPEAPVLVGLFVPNYVAAGIAIVPAVVLHGLGRRLSQARKELRQLGSYRLLAPLGKGGMGEVWRAEHAMLARPAAIKLIKPELLGDDLEERRTAVARFEREARATAALRSPHTVNVYDFGQADDGVLYYVMELLDGLDLDSLVARFGPVPAGRVVHLLQQACCSLAEAHAAGMVHRDIKPANLYACRLGVVHDFVKVLDFGLVSLHRRAQAASQDVRLTGEGFIVGTPAFMAPETVSGGQVDHRADIYALGCVAYWLLTGRHVFEGDTAMRVLIDHAKTPPEPPSRRSTQRIGTALERVILACLAKDPAERPQSALELSERLGDALPPEERWTERHARTWWEVHRPAEAPPTPPPPDERSDAAPTEPPRPRPETVETVESARPPG